MTGIRCPNPQGAFYVFPNIEGTGLSSRKFADDLLEKAGVACLSGESFGKFGNGYVRFSFANSATNIELALDRFKTYLEKDA